MNVCAAQKRGPALRAGTVKISAGRLSSVHCVILAVWFLFIATAPAQTFPSGYAVVTRNGSTDNAGYRFDDYGVYNGELWRYAIQNGAIVAQMKLSSGPATFPRVSPDGSKIAFIKKSSPLDSVCIIDISGGPVTRLTPCKTTSLIDFPSNDWIYFTAGSGQHDVNSRYLKRVRVSDGTVENVLTYPCNIAQINISRDLGRAVIRNSSPGVITCGDEKAYAYTFLTDSGSFGLDMTPGRICCVTAMFSDGKFGAFGWGGHDGTDIKPWGQPNTIHKKIKYLDAFAWPPNRNAFNPTLQTVGAVYSSRASTNDPHTECLVFHAQAFLLINWYDEQCINVTAGTIGNVGQGDFWRGPLTTSDTTPPTLAPASLSVSGVTESSVSLTFSALPQSADIESGIQGYEVFRGSLQTGGILTDTVFVDSGLAPGQTYLYQVAGVNGMGMSGPKTAPPVSAATLADRTPPFIRSAAAGANGTTITVFFSEKPDGASAQVAGNYALSGGFSISDARLSSDSLSVVLTVSLLTVGKTVTLAVQNVKDLSGNTIAPGAATTFVFIPGFKAYWQFEDSGKAAAVDASGNGFNGTLTGQAKYVGTDKKEGRFSLSLAGDGGFSAPLSAWKTAAFTVAFWIKPLDRIASQSLYASTGWGYFKFQQLKDGTLLCGIGTQDRFLFPTGVLEFDTWQHFAFTFSGGAAALYKNGILAQTASGWSNPGTWESFSIAGANGLFDDLRIYDTAFSSEGVHDIMTGVLQKKAISLSAPSPGGRFYSDSILAVRWSIEPILAPGGVMVDFSKTNGRFWYPLTALTISASDAAFYSGNYGRYLWTIPDTFITEGNEKIPTASDSCRIRVRAPYAPNTPGDVSGLFSIASSKNEEISPHAVPAALPGVRITCGSNGMLRIHGVPPGWRQAEIRDVSGRLICSGSLSGGGGMTFRLKRSGFGTGILVLKRGNTRLLKKFIIGTSR